jgi:hypothetical protein
MTDICQSCRASRRRLLHTRETSLRWMVLSWLDVAQEGAGIHVEQAEVKRKARQRLGLPEEPRF